MQASHASHKTSSSNMAVLSLMKSFCTEIRALVPFVLAALMVAVGALPSARAAPSPTATNEVWIKEIRGTAAISSFPATTWVETQTTNVLHAGDRLRVGPNSVVTLLLSDRSVATFGAGTVLQIRPPHEFGAEPGLHLFQGLLYFFHRGEPNQIQILTHAVMAGIKGTEFVVEVDSVDGVDRTRVYVLDGEVQLTNDYGSLRLTNGQSAPTLVGAAPRPPVGFIARNILQWCFYYPAVIDPNEVPLTAEEQAALHESLEAYRSGDLLAALAKYPPGRRPRSDAKRVYYAGLLLSVGQVAETQDILSELPTTDALGRIARLAGALRQLIAAVKREDIPSLPSPQLASEFLAASYYAQSRAIRTTSLEAALDLANRAKATSPQFGFAWVRAADVEFSFGRTARAREDLEKGLEITPTNAQARALKGFLLAAQNRTREAIEQFNRALAVDGGLGNAWLGRGLCRIRRGDLTGGREDLLLAAAIEPDRSLLRSYLGKAYAEADKTKLASHEFELAKSLDLNDPTPWLYSALLHEQNNHINQAVRDLERSEELNDNRSVYRSGLLLDQDQAVRGANLARIYQEAGMDEVALREASRAVSYDYANYSAHLFLANSYLALSDPNLVNLRYETPAEAEYLLANLLAPVGAGTLSPAISQQEYSRLFERDRLGFYSSTEYLSRGAWTQNAAQYGTYGTFSYDLEAFYRTDRGQWVNNDLEQRQLSLQVKQQLTPRDSVYLQATDGRITEGDVAQHYDPSLPAELGGPTDIRLKEIQEPMLSLGYHHEWQPGLHTLFFAARLDDKFSFTSLEQPTLLTFRPTEGLSGVDGVNMREDFRSHLEIYTTELQQIWQQPFHNTIAGLRVQYGHFHTESLQTDPTSFSSAFPDSPTPAAVQDVTSLFKRLSFYGYHQWQIADSVQLQGGVTYDRITFPENFRSAPISDVEVTSERVSPKAGFIWTPAKGTTLRFAYTRSLGGASLDQSFQLEPSQVAGFVQSFRSIIPESVVGANAGARFETFGLSLEQKLPTGTYLGLSGEILNSAVRRTDGAFDYFTDSPNLAVASGLRENLDYEEHALQFTVNQLLGDRWSIGARYRVGQAVLCDTFPNVPDGLFFTAFDPRQRLESVLQQLDLFAIYNHPTGLFAECESLWYAQSNRGYSPDLPGGEFWQFNAFLGYRFPRRRAEVLLGLLNITDQNYRINPLNLYNELPRNRTLALKFQFNF
jgi:Flp pilus assembly protein TadD